MCDCGESAPDLRPSRNEDMYIWASVVTYEIAQSLLHIQIKRLTIHVKDDA